MTESFKKIFLIYGGLVVTLVVPIAVLPYYLGYMGVELWGRYSLILLAQSILSILEAGLSQGITREFSKTNVEVNGLSKSAVFLKMFQKLYLTIIFVFSVVFFLVVYFVLPDKFSSEETFAVIIFFGASFLGGLYKSFVNSLQKAHVNYFISALSVIGKSLIGIFVLNFGFGFTGFLFSQVFIVICEILIRYAWVLKIVSKINSLEGAVDSKLGKKVIFDSIKMSSAVIFGVLVSQTDKVFAGYYLPLKEFGVYSICLTVLYGMLQLFYPLGQFYLPKIISDNAAGKSGCKKNYLYLMSGLGFFLMMVGLVFGKRLLNLWLQDILLASQVYIVIYPVFFGIFIYSISEYLYTLLVVNGNAKKIFIRNLSSFVFALAVSPIFFSVFGMVGGGYFWLCLTFIYLITSFGSKSAKGAI